MVAFYDLKTDHPVSVEEVITAPILFTVPVMRYAFKEGGWSIIGHQPLDEKLLEPPIFFMKDVFSGKFFITYDGGQRIPATRSEIEGHGRAAVWDPEHVEDRLSDHFIGRSNKWVQSLLPDAY